MSTMLESLLALREVTPRSVSQIVWADETLAADRQRVDELAGDAGVSEIVMGLVYAVEALQHHPRDKALEHVAICLLKGLRRLPHGRLVAR